MNTGLLSSTQSEQRRQARVAHSKMLFLKFLHDWRKCGKWALNFQSGKVTRAKTSCHGAVLGPHHEKSEIEEGCSWVIDQEMGDPG